MSDERQKLQSEIAELEKAAALYKNLPVVREPLEAQLAEKRQRLATLEVQQSGGVNFGVGNKIDKIDDVIGGDKVLGDKIIQYFFGGAPGEDGAKLLGDYLDALVGDCDQLRLSRLVGKRQKGSERRAAPELRLQDVYTSLTTEREIILRTKHRSLQWIEKLIRWYGRHNISSHHLSPEKVRHLRVTAQGKAALFLASNIVELDPPAAMVEARYEIFRPQLAIEAIYQAQTSSGPNRLVLLGEPGSGKSTVLRYLALLLARRIRGAPVHIPGWPADDAPVPLLVPLGAVAAKLAEHNGNADQALWSALEDVFDGSQGLRAGLRRFLQPALRDGGVLLLCDGLDELPAISSDEPVATSDAMRRAQLTNGPRAKVAKAIQRLAANTKARVVVTSRVLPYRADSAWLLSEDEGWEDRTIQPLAFGQVRTFVAGWYRALAASDTTLQQTQADERAAALISELEQSDRLRPLAESPLLLTMLALLHANTDGNIPRDRTRLYDECVQLLLERWEPVRSPGNERRSRLQELLSQLPGLELDKLRDNIHRLAYKAHSEPPGDDGRGLIDHDTLSGQMLGFFKRLNSANPGANVDTFLAIVREEAGLLVARDDETAYTFPHLTFEEFLAACHLAEQKDMSQRAYDHWQRDDRERWRTALLLMVGRLRQKGQKDVERDGVPWLKRLVAPKVRTGDATQQRRDALLAALSYAEMGGRAALSTSELDLVGEVETPLRAAIVDLLEHADLAIPTADRIAAARVLADLGDPRFPIEFSQWREELMRRSEVFGKPNGYWCYVPKGRYEIGGWNEGQPSAQIDLPHFWVARLPITVAQFAPFVPDGYHAEAETHWTENGWKWKDGRTEPVWWEDLTYADHRNQPIVGITWYEADAFCAWLTTQLGAMLPEGYVLRLPTDAEWETAAAFDGAGRCTYPWGNQPDPTPDLAIYDAIPLEGVAPVGCCPAGAATCGTLDMVGNVLECVTSKYTSYPRDSAVQVKDFAVDQWAVPLRGRSYDVDSTSVHCGTREWSLPDGTYSLYGFRVVVALQNVR